MRLIIIVGAGPGLGLSIAKRFGKHHFQVALIARRAESLEKLVHELKEEHVEAAAFPADVNDAEKIAGAFAAIRHKFGPAEILEFSPAPHLGGPFQPYTAVGTTVDEVERQFRFYTLGAITCAQQVLPDMIERRRGALLFTTAGLGSKPMPMLTPIGIAMAGVRNYALCLNHELKPTGVYAGHVAIATYIQKGTVADPDTIAAVYQDLYENRDRMEEIYDGHGAKTPDTLSGIG